MAAVIGAPTLMFPSGIGAAFAALLHYRPDVIAITGGYHGCHGAIGVYSKTREGVVSLDLFRCVALAKNAALKLA